MTYATQVMMKLKSRPQSISEVASFVDEIAKTYQIAPDVHGNVLISLTEAVNNAIIHGNRNDESKFVEITAKKFSEKLYFTVNDQGEGFDPASVPNPTMMDNLEVCGGRGLFLMHNLSNRVSYSHRGTSVRMEFNIAS
jgi:serine/threonine-protein kinase RsbW